MRLAAVALIVFLSSVPDMAIAKSNDKQSLIDRVALAYSDDGFQSVSSIEIVDHGFFSEEDYGFHPGLFEYDKRSTALILDLKNKLGSYDYRIAGDRFGYHNRIVSRSGRFFGVNYALETFAPEPYENYYQAFGSAMRTSDTILAFLLKQYAERSKIHGRSQYLGRNHTVIEFDFPEAGNALIYIDDNTGLISRMDRYLGDGPRLTYLWSDPQTKTGLTYAKTLQLHVDDHLELIVTDRTLRVNVADEESFKIDPRIKEAPPLAQVGQASHQQLGPNSYLTGLDGIYSVFADAGDYIIAAGLNDGFADRFEHFSRSIGQQKPLAYAVSTQHAGPHIGGIPEAVMLGATIIAPESHLEDFNRRFPEMASANKVIALNDRLELGPMEIYSVTTTSSDYLSLVYIPDAKTIYQTDSYNSIYTSAPGFAGIGGVALLEEIKRLGIKADTIAFVYNPTPEPFSNLEKAVQRFIENPCFKSRPIC